MLVGAGRITDNGECGRKQTPKQSTEKSTNSMGLNHKRFLFSKIEWQTHTLSCSALIMQLWGAILMIGRRQWHPTPVLLPGKSHRQRSLVGCSPWGRWESDTTSLSLFTFIHWRRKWQPTPTFLPGESQGWRSLVGCRLWGRTESDTTEAT